MSFCLFIGDRLQYQCGFRYLVDEHMATETIVYRSTNLSSLITKELLLGWGKVIKSYLPRRCMVVSTGLLAGGLCIPFLMGFALIPATVLLGFIGLISTCTGIILTIYYL
jgi:hypothetical protein